MTGPSPADMPLIISELSLVVSLVSAVGWIATAVMARVNLQRQIRAASREAWKRDFREKVVTLLAAHEQTNTRKARELAAPDPIEKAKRQTEMIHAQQAIILLITEIALPAEDFIDALGRFLAAPGNTEAAEAAAQALTFAAMRILKSVRADIEAPTWRWRRRLAHWRMNRKLWKLAPSVMAASTGDKAPSDPWSRFVTWCCGRPRFPT